MPSVLTGAVGALLGEDLRLGSGVLAAGGGIGVRGREHDDFPSPAARRPGVGLLAAGSGFGRRGRAGVRAPVRGSVLAHEDGVGGRTLGHRSQHLEAAYTENQEVQSDLLLLRSHGVFIPIAVVAQADRLGGLVYGLLRAEVARR